MWGGGGGGRRERESKRVSVECGYCLSRSTESAAEDCSRGCCQEDWLQQAKTSTSKKYL